MRTTRKIVVLVMVVALFSLASCNRVETKNVKEENDVPLSSCWGSVSSMDNSEKGYYIATFSDQVLFYDFVSKKTVPLCNKPECEHKEGDLNCNASLSGLCTNNIQYYEGNVYVIRTSAGGVVELYRFSQDGSNHEKVITLWESAADAENSINNFRVHKGYIYFLVPYLQENTYVSTHLYRMKLDGSEKEEVIYTNNKEGLRSSDIDISLYNDCIYFIDTYEFEGNDKEIKGEIYCYDPNTRRTEKLLENAYGDFFILRDELYYQNNGEPIRKYNLITKEITEFAPLEENNTWLWISSDGQYIYTDNFFDCELMFDEEYENRCILVYNLDGTIKDRISLKGMDGNVLFGDQHNIIYQNLEETYRLNKEQIATGEYEWIEMKINDTESF